MIRFATSHNSPAHYCDLSSDEPLPAQGGELDTLGDEIARLSAHIHAATYELLVMIREFDAQGGWLSPTGGFKSCGEWLSWRTGISPGAAREKVRVARALCELPLMSEKMRTGALSFSKARAMTRVARPDNEAALIDVSDHSTAAHMERIVGAWRRVDRLESAEMEDQRHRSRYLRLYQDEDGTFVLKGRLDPETGALVKKALDLAVDLETNPASDMSVASEVSIERGPDSFEGAVSLDERRADAIGLVAEMALAQAESGPEGGRRNAKPSRGDRFQVVLHIPCESTSAETAVPSGVARGCREGTGFHVSAETSRRLACDAGLVLMTHDGRGEVLDVGRRRRTVPIAIRRALEWRDRCCRFPGCSRTHTQAHHIKHWARGGSTALDNLVLLCQRHHRAVHEGGWTIRLDRGTAVFLPPNGDVFTAAPPTPTVPDNPLAALVRAHAANGINPHKWTATPDWHGEALDLCLTIDTLRAVRGEALEGGPRLGP